MIWHLYLQSQVDPPERPGGEGGVRRESYKVGRPHRLYDKGPVAQWLRRRAYVNIPLGESSCPSSEIRGSIPRRSTFFDPQMGMKLKMDVIYGVLRTEHVVHIHDINYVKLRE